MQISSITIVESLKGKLLAFPALVNSLQNKDLNFLSSLEIWMKETENIMKNNNISQCSEIAGLRSKIIAPSFDVSQKRSAKKMQLHIASGLLYELQNIVLAVIKPHENKIDEARNLLIHLLSILKQSGAIKYTKEMNFQNFINQIWKLFSTHEQLKPSTVNVLALVSQVDAIRLIADEINLEEWK